MSSKNLPRFVATLALAVCLALLPAAAHASPQSGAAGGPRSFAMDVLDALAQLWSGLVRAWEADDAGMLIDPDGNSSTSEGDDDAGMLIDPDGSTSEEDGDNGMLIDPNG